MDKNSFTEVAFYGKITAGITHELKNVLATIKETTGLMGDILGMKESEAFQYSERFQKAISTIQKQVDHGAAILTNLNAFAHSPDKEIAEIDLYEATQDIIFLCERSLRQKNILVNIHPPASSAKMTVRPVSFQCAIFLCLDFCMSGLPLQSRIDISIEKNSSDPEYRIQLNCSENFLKDENEAAKEESEKRIQILNEIAHGFGGTITKTLNTLCLCVPGNI